MAFVAFIAVTASLSRSVEKTRGQRAEVRDQRSETGESQRSEVRGQRSEIVHFKRKESGLLIIEPSIFPTDSDLFRKRS